MAHLPVSSISFLERAEELVKDAVAGNVTRSLLKKRLLEIDPRKVKRGAAGQHEAIRLLDLMTFKGVAECIWGSFDDTRKYRLFRKLSDVLAPLRGHIPARFSLGLWFPIASFSVPHDDKDAVLPCDAPAEVIVGFWFRVVHALADFQNVAPSFFWRARASPAPLKENGAAKEASSDDDAFTRRNLSIPQDRHHRDLTETDSSFRIRSYRRFHGTEEAAADVSSLTNRAAGDTSSEQHDPAFLYFFRPPPPNGFTQLLPVNQVEPNICRLEASNGEKAATVALSIPRKMGEALESETASLLDVIDAVRA
jgi:hypothetical protein